MAASAAPWLPGRWISWGLGVRWGLGGFGFGLGLGLGLRLCGVLGGDQPAGDFGAKPPGLFLGDGAPCQVAVDLVKLAAVDAGVLRGILALTDGAAGAQHRQADRQGDGQRHQGGDDPVDHGSGILRASVLGAARQAQSVPV